MGTRSSASYCADCRIAGLLGFIFINSYGSMKSSKARVDDFDYLMEANLTNLQRRDGFLMSRKNDYVFKRVFGDERNAVILVDFINAVIDEDVVDVTILNPEFRRETTESHFGILDVKARTSEGTFIDVEIQLNQTLAYDRRILYYWSRLYSEQLKKNEEYDKLEKTIAISIVDYMAFSDGQLHHRFMLMDKQSGIQFTDVIEIHFLELKKLPIFSKRAIENGEMDILDQWLYFIGTESQEVIEMISKKNSTIKYAYEIVDHMSKDALERRAYEARETMLHEEATRVKGAYLKGVADGKEQGKIEGREVGREEGYKQAMLGIAKSMKARGDSVASIMAITGLSEAEVEALTSD